MSVLPPGPEQLQSSRAAALRRGLPVLVAVCVASALMLVSSPTGRAWEAWLHLSGGLVCLALIWPVRRAQARGDIGTQERIAYALLTLLLLLFLQRIATLLFDVAVRDPDISLFRPVFAFLPCLYLGALLLLPSRRALQVSWLLGAAVLAVSLSAVLINGWSWERAGVPELALWLLLGNPLMLIALRALPGIEDALNSSVRELGELRERNQLLAQLADNERRFNLVVDSLQVGVWDQRFEQGRLVGRWWSPRFYQLLGYSAERLPADEDGARRIFGEQMLPIRDGIYERLRQHGVTTADARLKTAERGWRWFNIAAKAEFDEQGRFTRIAGAIEDIHDRRMAEQELLEAQSELAQLAYRDPLTGLPNRRAFDEQVQREWERAHRVAQPLSLIAIDLDWFKSYNDRYGHPAGDEYLRLAARCFRDALHRPADFATRVGGEEFFVLLPETDPDGALQVALKIEASLRALAVPHADSPWGVVTCSVGVATVVPRERDTAAELVRRADGALYRSKREGRGQVRQDLID